ncbi:MAG: fumarate hydratase [Endomicrobium sp.]|nr:fumarate hydratase [Endomicrobium sp.]
MRKIKSEIIINAVADVCSKANFDLPEDILRCLRQCVALETGIAKDIFGEIIENADIAKKEQIPLCQDTGTANFFIKLGKDIIIEDGNIYDAINKGVSSSYVDNYLRKSIVSDPLERKNTQDNTPASVYVDTVDGNEIEIIFLPSTVST